MDLDYFSVLLYPHRTVLFSSTSVENHVVLLGKVWWWSGGGLVVRWWSGGVLVIQLWSGGGLVVVRWYKYTPPDGPDC